MSERMTDAELAEIEARCGAATKGPWKKEDAECMYILDQESRVVAIVGLLRWRFGSNGLRPKSEPLSNFDFIALSRTDIPRLIAEVRALREEVDEKERLFELQWKRTMKAVEAWREAMKNKSGDQEYLESIDTTIPDLGDILSWLLDERKEARAEVDALRKGPAGWEADHQRRALEAVGLAEEFPFGCDAIESVADALIASRKEVERLLEALDRIGKLSAQGNRHVDDYGEIAREALKGGGA